MPNAQKRVLLWSCPRSTNTLFARIMENRDNTKVLVEPFCVAYFLGPERISKRFAKLPIKEGATFAAQKAVLEAPYEDYGVVFAKEIALSVTQRPDMAELLPRDYVHTFLLRNPERSVLSDYKLMQKATVECADYFDPYEIDYKHLHDMFVHVTEVLGQKAIVVESDDLLNNPEPVLRRYCELAGIDYQQTMVNWECPPKADGIFNDPDFDKGWFEDIINSTHIMKAKPINRQVLEALPDEPKAAIAHNLPYYRLMYEHRLMVEGGSDGGASGGR